MYPRCSKELRSHCICIEAVDDNSENSSTQFLQFQNIHLIDWQQLFQKNCDTLPVFGFNNARYDIQPSKRNLPAILVNERDTEHNVLKKSSQFAFFKCGNIQLLEILNFLEGATNLDSKTEAYKTSEIKRFLAYEWFNQLDKVN